MLWAAFPGAFEDKQDIAAILDTELFTIALTETRDIAAVCIFRIIEGADLERQGDKPWGEITWLGTRPDLQRRGFGKAALTNALEVIQIRAEDSTFGLYANHLSDDNAPTAVEYYTKLGMSVLIRSDGLPLYKLDNEGEEAAKFMTGDIDTVLGAIGDVPHCSTLVDAGSYDAIKCKIKRGGRREFFLHFLYGGWDGQGIGPLLDGTSEIDWAVVEPKLNAMGITKSNVADALSKPSCKVTLNGGARPQLDGTADHGAMRAIKYCQQNLYETDEMCVIKAAANAIDIFDPSAAEKVITTAATGRLKMKQVAAILREAGVRTAAVKEEDPMFLLEQAEGVYLTQLVDGNGCKGHAVAIDAGRKVIIDPAEKHELLLSLRNLNKCCGLASICCGLYLLQKLDIPKASDMDLVSEDDGAGVFPKGNAGQPSKARGQRGKRKKSRKKKQHARKRACAEEAAVPVS
eukprot:COSAG01_NODE_550_length_15593_cov_12.422422_12_plen_461_part_00